MTGRDQCVPVTGHDQCVPVTGHDQCVPVTGRDQCVPVTGRDQSGVRQVRRLSDGVCVLACGPLRPSLSPEAATFVDDGPYLVQHSTAELR